MSLCTTAHFLGMSQLDAAHCFIEMTLRTRDQLASASFGLIMFDGGTLVRYRECTTGWECISSHEY